MDYSVQRDIIEGRSIYIREQRAMAKMGRKTKYEADFPERVQEMCGQGLIDKQIAENLGISLYTFYEWKKKKPDFAKAIKDGKKVADQHVESALYRRACGYEYKEYHEELVNKPLQIAGKVIKGQLVTERKTKTVTKQRAPDTLAGIFWLKNRVPSRWRDKQEHQHSGEVSILLDKRFAKV